MRPYPAAQKQNRIRLDEELCKGCGLCRRVCPHQVFSAGERRNRAGYLVPKISKALNCSGCLLCEITCPDLALMVEKE